MSLSLFGPGLGRDTVLPRHYDETRYDPGAAVRTHVRFYVFLPAHREVPCFSCLLSLGSNYGEPFLSTALFLSWPFPLFSLASSVI